MPLRMALLRIYLKRRCSGLLKRYYALRLSQPVLYRSVTPQVVPRHNWSPGPSTANCVAADGPPDQLCPLPWMVRFVTNGPGPRETNRVLQHRLITIP